MLRLAILFCALASAAFSGPADGPAKLDCYCTDRSGARVELGEFICIDVGQTPYMAQCVMVLNNPFWRKIRDGCLSSRLGMSVPVAPLPG